MKITDVEVIVVRQDEVKMIGDGSQDTAVILVHTDEGITADNFKHRPRNE